MSFSAGLSSASAAKRPVIVKTEASAPGGPSIPVNVEESQEQQSNVYFSQAPQMQASNPSMERHTED